MPERVREMHDGYLRVNPGGASHRLKPTHPLPMVFVDIDVSPDHDTFPPADCVKHIRNHLDLFDDRVRGVVFRWPLLWRYPLDEKRSGEGGAVAALAEYEELAAKGKQLVASLTDAPVGVLVQAIGRRSRLLWQQDLPEDAIFPDDAAVLRRLRLAELRCLLDTGHAVWRPFNHHYRLPSGAHAGTFVRIADAARTPHDSFCLASWLTEVVSPGCRLILDSATLNPVAVSLQALAARSGIPFPEVDVVENYHQTSFDLRQMMVGASSLLIVQSVSSTGSLTERLTAALDRSGLPGVMHVLVDRQRVSSRATESAVEAAVSIDRWMGLAELDEVYANAAVCRFCSDPERGRLVQIDPISFAGTLLPRPKLVSPSIRAARHNRGLWELADARQAIGPLASPSSTTRERRPRSIDVKFYVGELFRDVSDASLAAALRTRVASNWKRMIDRELHTTDLVIAWTPDPDDWRPIDAPPDDEEWERRARANTKEVLDLVFSTLAERGSDQELRRGTPELLWVDRNNPVLSREETQQLQGAREVLIFDWSTVTGTLLRQLVSHVRGWIRPARHTTTIRGLVVHARPESARSFEDLQEAFDDRDLVALWLTFMPMTVRSPFAREERLLGLLKTAVAGGAVGSLDGLTRLDVMAFVDERLEFLKSHQQDWRRRRNDFVATASSAEVTSPYAVFWGLPLRLQLTETSGLDAARRSHGRSLFGSRLDSITLLAAAGNAVQTVRHEGASGPEWQQFDLPLAIDAFHQSTAVVAFLRWLGPEEIWWGDTPESTQRTISALIYRADDDEEAAVVVSELLLAAAEGKVPVRYAHIPIEHARSMVQDPDIEPYQRMALHTGIVLAQSDLPADLAERRGIIERIHDLGASLVRANFDLREAANILKGHRGPQRS